jgi:transposase
MTKSTKSSKTKPASLSQLNPKCAGIDVGAAELFVCIAKNSSEQEVRTFSTFTADIKLMIQWLKKNKVESVAMESTGVYWIPPYELLEEAGFEVLLVNARFFKAVPGRKTDVQDCQWIQQLHSYGLLRGSFRPTNEIVSLRAYVRQRSRLFESAGTQVQLMHKSLTLMNIQLNHVISDITGLSGTNIIQAILRGQRDPKALAELCAGNCRKNKDLIAKALEGNYRKEHVFSLEQAYEAYEFFHKQIVRCEQAIQQILESIQPVEPVKEAQDSSRDQAKKTETLKITLPKKKCAIKKTYNRSPYGFYAADAIKKVTKADLTTIPGIDANTAMKILAEIGTDMSCWRSAKAFASWLGLCPGNKVSGGKVLSSKTKPSDNKAAQALRMAAASLYNSTCYLGAFFRRMRSRLGAPKAITAVAHKLAKILYRMLMTGEDYRELGENYYEQQYQERVLENLKRRAKEMGYALAPILQ